MPEIELSQELLDRIDFYRGDLSRDEFVEMALTAITNPISLEKAGMLRGRTW